MTPALTKPLSFVAGTGGRTSAAAAASRASIESPSSRLRLPDSSASAAQRQHGGKPLAIVRASCKHETLLPPGTACSAHPDPLTHRKRLTWNRSSVVVRHAESSGHRALDTEHLPEGVFVSVLDLEVVPVLPEGLVLARVAQVGRVHVDGTGTVDLPELALQLSIPEETRRLMSGAW